MNILLVANYTKTLAYEAMQMAAHWLSEHGQAVRQVTSEKLLRGQPLYEELRATITDYQLVVSFGGDGTILRVATVISTSQVPLLGINYGELGFLAGASSARPLAALEAVLADEVSVEQRYLLRADVSFASGSCQRLTALNEVSLGRSDPGRDISLGVAINGYALPDVRGDGMIVAAPSGSTAYALSAGGPILTPTIRGLVLVPVMPHNLALRPIVMGSTDRVELTYRSRFSQTLVFAADGQQIVSSEENDHILQLEVGLASEQLNLLRFDAPDFYAHTSNAFFGGAPC